MALRTRLVLLFTLAAIGLGVVFGLVLARRLQLGLESDLDGVMRERATEVAATIAAESSAQRLTGPDLSAAQGPAQLVTPSGRVVAGTGGASDRSPLMPPRQLRRARSGVFIIDAVVRLGGERTNVRVLARPVAGDLLLATAEDRETVDGVVDRTGWELVLLGTPAVALVALGVWLVTGAALRPVDRMRAQAAASVPGRTRPLPVPRGADELSRLAVTLNDLLASQDAALRAEQSFLADAGHELRTPLAILAGELELADRPARTVAELRATVTVAREETERLVRLAEQLLVLARLDGAGLHRRLVDVDDLAERALVAWTGASAARGVALELLPGPPVQALVDPDRTRQVLDNLLSNALRVAPPGSRVEVGLRALGESPAGVELAVRDSGPGFPPDFLPRAFERFARADPARARTGSAEPSAAEGSAGSGLGLAVVQHVATAHGGVARAQDAPGGGALVRVSLPGPPPTPDGAGQRDPVSGR